MGRIVFFVVLAVGIYVAFRLWRSAKRRDSGAAQRREASAESMIRCEHCGLNVPKSEAIGDAGRWYCSENHRRLDLDRR